MTTSKHHTVESLPAHYDAVVFSPHFDDAALSLGGLIAQHTAQGQTVLVVTVCSAPPPAAAALSAFARQLHHNWGAATDPMAVRRQEDQTASQLLGADWLWLDEHDAVYRSPAYDSVDAIFGTVAPDDHLAARLHAHLEHLHQQLPDSVWYAPLAVGNHVDHQITYAVVRQFATQHPASYWYEDLPYAAAAEAVAQRISRIDAPLQPTLIDITTTLDVKLAAIAAYASQMLELFGTEATMRDTITDYAARCTAVPNRYAERVWQVTQ